MLVKNNIKILLITILLILFSSLTGCIGSPTNETQIMQIAEDIEKAIGKKDVSLFMENVSYDYSDLNGGTYDNYINHLPEELFLKTEVAEDLIDIFPLLEISTKVTIPESELVLMDTYASGRMTIKISLEACVAWVICANLYNENIEYNVDFIKEDDDWKIISMMEI